MVYLRAFNKLIQDMICEILSCSKLNVIIPFLVIFIQDFYNMPLININNRHLFAKVIPLYTITELTRIVCYITHSTISSIVVCMSATLSLSLSLFQFGTCYLFLFRSGSELL